MQEDVAARPARIVVAEHLDANGVARGGVPLPGFPGVASASQCTPLLLEMMRPHRVVDGCGGRSPDRDRRGEREDRYANESHLTSRRSLPPVPRWTGNLPPGMAEGKICLLRRDELRLRLDRGRAGAPPAGLARARGRRARLARRPRGRAGRGGAGPRPRASPPASSSSSTGIPATAPCSRSGWRPAPAAALRRRSGLALRGAQGPERPGLARGSRSGGRPSACSSASRRSARPLLPGAGRAARRPSVPAPLPAQGPSGPGQVPGTGTCPRGPWGGNPRRGRGRRARPGSAGRAARDPALAPSPAREGGSDERRPRPRQPVPRPAPAGHDRRPSWRSQRDRARPAARPRLRPRLVVPEGAGSPCASSSSSRTSSSGSSAGSRP